MTEEIGTLRKHHRNKQILSTLREAEGGTPAVEICRRAGITEQTFYRCGKKFVGKGIAEMSRLRELEEENRKLRGMVADLGLDKHMLQWAPRKNVEGGPAPLGRALGCG